GRPALVNGRGPAMPPLLYCAALRRLTSISRTALSLSCLTLGALAPACSAPAPGPAGSPAGASAPGPAAAASAGRSVVVLYTTDRAGYLEPCGCQREPLGFIDRLAGL